MKDHRMENYYIFFTRNFVKNGEKMTERYQYQSVCLFPLARCFTDVLDPS